MSGMDALTLIDLCIHRFCSVRSLVLIPYFIRNVIKNFLRAPLNNSISVLRAISSFTEEDEFWYWSARKITVTNLRFPAYFMKATMTKALVGALQISNSLIQLDLSRNHIGDECMKCLGNILSRHVVLTTVTFQEIQLRDEGALSVALFLTTNQSITALNLDSNSITDVGANALAAAISSNFYLTHLYLGKNCIGNSGAIAFANALKKNSTLKLLHLPARVMVLGSDERKNQKITVVGAIALADALTINCSLTDMDLTSQCIGDDGVLALANSLRVNTVLRRLSLASNSIQTCLLSDDSVVELADALKSNASIEVLNLRENSIEVAGAVALADVLRENTCLTELYLGNSTRGFDLDNSSTSWFRNKKWFECNCVGDDGIAAFSEVLMINNTLKVLDLSQNDIGCGGAQCIAVSLRVNSSITDLDLSMNAIEDDGAFALVTAIAVNCRFNLNVQHNPFSYEARTALEEAWSSDTENCLFV